MKVGIIIGIPFLLISLILGTQWAHVVLSEWSIFDFKIIGSFFILVLYILVLLAVHTGRLRGNNSAWANVFAFFLLLLIFSLAVHCPDFTFGFNEPLMKGLI